LNKYKRNLLFPFQKADMKKILLLLILFTSLKSIGQSVYGDIVYMSYLGIPSDTLHPRVTTKPHFAIKGDDSFVWSVAQQKWIILIAGGNTYSAGTGLTLGAFTFKADTFLLATQPSRE
jgi:hypothetical protein